MTSEFVAEQAVLAMRCNRARILLPKLTGYLTYLTRTFMPRSATILTIKALGLAEGIKEIKGRAAVAAS